jgi:hypothetical protein
VRRILDQCHVRLYPSSQIDDLIAEIRAHGRELNSSERAVR